MIERLKAVCHNDPASLWDLAVAAGEVALTAGQPSLAEAALTEVQIPPSSALYPKSQWLKLEAARGAGDGHRFRAARDAFLAAHEERVLQLGFTKTEHFSTRFAEIDAYRGPNASIPLFFVATPRGDNEPASVVAEEREDETAGTTIYGLERYFCWESRGLGSIAGTPDESIDYASAKAQVIKTFSDPVDSSQRFDSSCPNKAMILPGFGEDAQFIGDEYASGEVTPTEEQLVTLFSGDASQRKRAADYVVVHPDAVAPMQYIYLVKTLMEQGDAERAAFWYYVWEIRIAPWAAAGGDEYGQLVGALSMSLGAAIDEWAGSDPVAMRQLMLRAITFERRVPLYSGKPDGLLEADWAALVEKWRTKRDEKALDRTFGNAAALANFEAQRREAGLYIGPWKAPGSPLPDDWQ